MIARDRKDQQSHRRPPAREPLTVDGSKRMWQENLISLSHVSGKLFWDEVCEDFQFIAFQWREKRWTNHSEYVTHGKINRFSHTFGHSLALTAIISQTKTQIMQSSVKARHFCDAVSYQTMAQMAPKPYDDAHLTWGTKLLGKNKWAVWGPVGFVGTS